MLPNYFGPHIEYGAEEHQAILKKVLRNVFEVIRISVMMRVEGVSWFKTVSFQLSIYP